MSRTAERGLTAAGLGPVRRAGAVVVPGSPLAKRPHCRLSGLPAGRQAAVVLIGRGRPRPGLLRIDRADPIAPVRRGIARGRLSSRCPRANGPCRAVGPGAGIHGRPGANLRFGVRRLPSPAPSGRAPCPAGLPPGRSFRPAGLSPLLRCCLSGTRSAPWFLLVVRLILGHLIHERSLPAPPARAEFDRIEIC